MKKNQNARSQAYVVSPEEAQRMQSANIDPKVGQKIKQNSKKFRKSNLKKNKKGIVLVTSLILTCAMAVGAFFVNGYLKKHRNGSKDSTSTSQDFDGMTTGSLDSLGEKLPNGTKKTEMTKVSGDFNIEDVVRGADGLLYVDAESAALAVKSGTTEIDTKGGTLVVADNGKVYTKEEGYEIVDSNGNVIESGNGTPSTITGGIDYIECPCNYYDDEGTLVHAAGELITPKELETCKKYYHTTKPQGNEYVTVEEEIIYYDNTTNSSGSSETTTYNEETYEVAPQSSNQGTFNADGTYTIYGVTYLSYADYQQYIMNGGEGYGYIDGIIQPIGDYEIEYQYTR